MSTHKDLSDKKALEINAESKRKSKSLLVFKSNGQAYCTCRTTDCTGFMIGCDGCEEWYHGDCIGISEMEAKYINKYYCCQCKRANPELQTIFRLTPAEQDKGSDRNAKKLSLEFISGTKKKCGICDGCRRVNCNQCVACRNRVGHKRRCMERKCTNQSSDVDESSSIKRKKENRSEDFRSNSSELYLNPELMGLRHCLGPGCCFQARPQSKYCSDLCGYNMATNRIFQVLPQRLQEWNLTPCRASEVNRTQLDAIRTEQSKIHRILIEIDKRSDQLDEIVELAKRSKINPHWAKSIDDTEDEHSMYCITCGHEIHLRTAIKHMEKCFNKYESQTSFVSKFKTHMEGNNTFCDFHNPESRMYCKRLRVMCPEHCKDPKVSDKDVCGAPLIRDVFNQTGEFCHAPKISCVRHFAWEKIQRAEIGMERVRNWLKLDELAEKERLLLQKLSSRANILGLMLHSTCNHEVMDVLMRKQQEHFAECDKKRRQQ